MHLRLRGGYNIMLAGRPAGRIDVLPEADTLYLPVKSRRFSFSHISVQDGQTVQPGSVLATDPDQFGVPLLAPRAGTVRLDAADGHLVIENASPASPEPHHADDKREQLVRLGAWQFFEDAHTGRPPDPSAEPRAILVSTVRLEPFLARGDAQLAARLADFERGLEHVQSLLEYQPIYLVMPDVQSALADEIHEALRGHAWLQIVPIPRRYPFDHFAVLARRLGLMADPEQPVWALHTEGVLAVDRALAAGLPVTERIISIGGPAVNRPRHASTVPGYPLEALLAGAASTGPVRIANGGVLTGDTIEPGQRGLDVECAGLTVLAEPTEREFLGFTRPGWSRRSYSRCFLSVLRRAFPEPPTAALRGERRACVACGQCEQVCPAGIMPHLIHKALYEDDLDRAERLRVDLCIACGLCAYVCPSKIELRQQFIEAQETLRAEHEAETEEARA